jgi:hypothetical protein
MLRVQGVLTELKSRLSAKTSNNVTINPADYHQFSLYFISWVLSVMEWLTVNEKAWKAMCV